MFTVILEFREQRLEFIKKKTYNLVNVEIIRTKNIQILIYNFKCSYDCFKLIYVYLNEGDKVRKRF